MSDVSVKAFAEASRFWEADEVARARRSEQRAWVVAATGMATGLAACVAVALLTPLKTVEPFVVRVDKNTGATDIVTRLDEQTVTFNEALDKYFLARYVNYREEYSAAMAFPDYEAVSLMSARNVGDAYYGQIKPDNPQSPSKVYGTDGSVEIAVNSIAFLGKGVAQVRFARTERLPNASPRETSWIATITYRYLKTVADAKARLINPVGFQVADYRLDPVTVPTGS
jgi:type IV secretion system protein VirB8